MKRAIAVMIVVLAFCLAGCAIPGKVTGGGWIESQACANNFEGDENGASCGKANFGFMGSSCGDDGEISGHFNFHDKYAPQWAEDGGVKMNGVVVEAHECVDPDLTDVELECAFCRAFHDDDMGYGQVYTVKVAYTSKNPKLRGEGTAFACVVDNGEGFNADASDMALFAVKSGPFDGYFNAGYVQGNIQAHYCD